MGKRKAETDPDVIDSDHNDELTASAIRPSATDTLPVWHNKEKVLLLSSRGITHRYTTKSQQPPLSVGLHCQYPLHWKSYQSLESACRHRHLLLDLTQLLPHCKKDAKLDTKTDKGVINEVADMKVFKSPPSQHPLHTSPTSKAAAFSKLLAPQIDLSTKHS